MINRLLKLNTRNINNLTKRSLFTWSDPFRLTTLLTNEEIITRETVKSYCQDKLMPRILEANRNEYFDKSIMKEMGELGLLGCTLYGSSYVSYGLIANEIEKVDSSYRSAFSVQSSLVMYPIHTFGSKFQKEKYLPDLQSGDKIGFC